MTMRFLFLLLTPMLVAQMPNAVKVCDEGCTITAMPVGTAYQFGTAKTWLAPATSTATFPKFGFSTNYTSFASDPAPGVLKEFDVQQRATAYKVSYSVGGITTTLTIPALPTTNYLLTCIVSVPSGTPPATLPLNNCTLVKQ